MKLWMLFNDKEHPVNVYSGPVAPVVSDYGQRTGYHWREVREVKDEPVPAQSWFCTPVLPVPGGMNWNYLKYPGTTDHGYPGPIWRG